MSQEKGGTTKRLYSQIDSKLKEAFPKGFSIVGGSPRSKEISALPAIYFDVINYSRKTKHGSGELDISFELEVRLIYQSRQDGPALARDTGLMLMSLLDGLWVEGMSEPIKFTRLEDDFFDSIMTGYETLTLTFEGAVRIGKDIFTGDEIYAAWAESLGTEVSL